MGSDGPHEHIALANGCSNWPVVCYDKCKLPPRLRWKIRQASPNVFAGPYYFGIVDLSNQSDRVVRPGANLTSLQLLCGPIRKQKKDSGSAR
jgi:hypothetical protein